MKFSAPFLVLIILFLCAPKAIRTFASTYGLTNYTVCPQSRFNNLYPAGTFILKKKCAIELRNMLHALVSIMKKLHQPCFLAAGSLLGHQRHQKSFIPWDDDIDVYTPALSLQTIRALEKELAPLYAFVHFNGWYKVISKKIALLDRMSIAVDVFEYVLIQNESTLVLKNEKARAKWPKETYNVGDIFPVKESTFCGVTVDIPRHPLKVLKQAYGEDCMEVAYTNHVHGAFAYLSFPTQTKIEITEKNNLPGL
jgi:hypothetical protein